MPLVFGWRAKHSPGRAAEKKERDGAVMKGSRSLRRGWLVLLLLLSAGCSSKGTISGKITYQGKPLAAGTVTFVQEQGGGSFGGTIRNGEYKVEGVPPGPVKIAVSTSSTPNRAIGKMQPPPEVLKSAVRDRPAEEGAKSEVPETVPIPPKFQSPDTSGLTYTVTSGKQVHDIDIPAK
jgi:hypothetical protein